MTIQFLNSLGGLLASLLSVSWRVQFLCSAFIFFKFCILDMLQAMKALQATAPHSSRGVCGGLPHIYVSYIQ